MTSLPGADVVLVRYGDISTKSTSVRRHMEDRLVANIEWTLSYAEIDAQVDREWTRPIVVPDSSADLDAAAETVANTIGVVSTSQCRRVSPDVAAILGAVRDVAETDPPEGSFAIDVRRADKAFPLSSMELEREAGSVVFETLPDSTDVEVDLDDPETTIHIEVRSEAAYLYTEIIDGHGGLPVGSQAPCVALISGGIDSPVAAFQVMRRGCPIVPIYFDLGPYSGPDHQARALESIASLRVGAASTAQPVRLVPAGRFVTDLVERVDRGRMLVLRRFMFRVADRIASDVTAKGIVTGEAIGQKSSQTATNLCATSVAADRPIHRPLLALDKNEITELARELGTYRSATIDAGCPSIAPDQVATRATVDELDALEPDDIDQWVAQAFEEVELIEVDTLESYAPAADPPAR